MNKLTVFIIIFIFIFPALTYSCPRELLELEKHWSPLYDHWKRKNVTIENIRDFTNDSWVRKNKWISCYVYYGRGEWKVLEKTKEYGYLIKIKFVRERTDDCFPGTIFFIEESDYECHIRTKIAIERINNNFNKSFENAVPGEIILKELKEKKYKIVEPHLGN